MVGRWSVSGRSKSSFFFARGVLFSHRLVGERIVSWNTDPVVWMALWVRQFSSVWVPMRQLARLDGKTEQSGMVHAIISFTWTAIEEAQMDHSRLERELWAAHEDMLPHKKEAANRAWEAANAHHRRPGNDTDEAIAAVGKQHSPYFCTPACPCYSPPTLLFSEEARANYDAALARMVSSRCSHTTACQ